MSNKLRAALVLALFAGIVTMAICFINNTRPYTILFRTVITFLLFGVCGFWLIGRAEPFYNKLKGEMKPKGQNIDIVSENEQSEMVETEAIQEFTPLTPGNLEHLTRPKQ